jgi:hypothetical protein
VFSLEEKMAETENSINTCETAPLLQEHSEESTQPPPDNGAGRFIKQTMQYEELSLSNM